jgi:lipid-A-disaccharide synthase
MKYYIIAGEASGDIHGGNVVRELARTDKNPVFKGVGGERLAKAGVSLLFGLDRLSFMGFYEVLKHIFIIRKNFRDIKADLLEFNPDVVILIDYPGFNLRIAKWCKLRGYKVAYYIAPQIWAWNEKRVETIKKNVDKVLCILPFEVGFYNKHHYLNAYYTGHPLLDELASSLHEGVLKRETIALLPGSRKQEITALLPLQLEVASRFPNERFIIAGISRLTPLYNLPLPENVQIIWDKTYDILKLAKAAIVCSGTATLETALFNVPQVVIYKTSWLNYQIGKRLAKVSYISLPNLITNSGLVTELIQHDCSAERIEKELAELLNVNHADYYAALKDKIGTAGASAKAAMQIYELALSS